MPRLFKRNITRGAVALLIFLAGTVAGFWRYEQVRGAFLTALAGEAQRSAVAFDAAELRQLAGTRADLDTPVYASVKDRLFRLGVAGSGVRRVYIVRHLPATHHVILLADSEPAGATSAALPGDDFAAVSNFPGLDDVRFMQESAAAGPRADALGSWVMAHAPIGPGQPGLPREILGLRQEAGSLVRDSWLGGLGAAGFVWILLGLTLVARMISLRQLAQREAIRNLSEAVEQSHSAVMIVDLQSRIEYANAGLCRQIGYERHELIGRPWRDFQVKETPPELLANLVATVRSGRSWTGEWFNRRKAGEVYPVRGVVTPVKRRDGSLGSFVAVLDDMTEIKRIEAELREAKEQAEAGDRAKSQFLATMSHEVRTPLNGIVGFTHLLLEMPLAPEPHEYVESIRTSAAALVQLTGDILDFARIESGKLKLEPRPCDVRECVEDALDLLAAQAAAKQLELLHWIDDDVPAVVVMDAGRLRQVLVNLVGNAVKFTVTGEIEVTVAAAGAGMLEFSVRDTGPGIVTGQQHRLFKAFSQIDASSTRKHGGAGLGLVISQTLVQMMGGRISVASEPGTGATFTFTIQAQVYAESGERPLRMEPAGDRPLDGTRLALVTRAPGLQRELERLGRRWGAQLVVVPEFDALTAAAFDLALVDVDDALAQRLAVQLPDPAGRPAEKPFGLVPLSLATSCRQALRSHFRLLVNKPVHHAALLKLLLGPRHSSETKGGTEWPFAHFAVRVLLVEDNPVNQRLMQSVLASLGCHCDLAQNGFEAIEELPRGRYDIVLMDLHVPEAGGSGAIEKIRAGEVGEEWRDLWIIAHTPVGLGDQRVRAMAAGADDFLAKPFKIAEFAAALRKFLQARKARE